MTRRLLATTMALGLIVTAMGFSGIYAVFSDRATTGSNSAVSGDQARVAELKIATQGVAGSCPAGSFVDDLATGIIAAVDLQPGAAIADVGYVCLWNRGSATANVYTSVIELSETETGCTGDEAGAGDTTCGTAGDGDGDLGGVLQVEILTYDCESQVPTTQTTAPLASLDDTVATIATLAPDETTCVKFGIYIPAAGGSYTIEQIQIAQSDQATWRFAFDAVAQ